MYVIIRFCFSLSFFLSHMCKRGSFRRIFSKFVFKENCFFCSCFEWREFVVFWPKFLIVVVRVKTIRIVNFFWRTNDYKTRAHWKNIKLQKWNFSLILILMCLAYLSFFLINFNSLYNQYWITLIYWISEKQKKFPNSISNPTG